MKNKYAQELIIAKIFILIAFLFFTYGTYTYFKDYQVSQTVPKTTTISKSGKSISVTTTNNDNQVASVISDAVNAASSSEKAGTTSATDTKIPTNVIIPQQSVEPTISDINNSLREKIQNVYGITVRYGLEDSNYVVGGMSTNIVSDDYVVNKALNSLITTLTLYPTNFFKEFQKAGFSLTINLIKDYSVADVTGVTDSATKKVIMSLATDYDFVDSFNHETYHYIDDYLMAEGGKYTTWASLNPSSFTYGDVDNSLTYSKTRNSMAYFVNDYAETDEYEDRASTFEYMMASNKASCLNIGTPINLKARYIASQIDLFFDTVTANTTEYWERYVY